MHPGTGENSRKDKMHQRFTSCSRYFWCSHKLLLSSCQGLISLSFNFGVIKINLSVLNYLIILIK